MNMLNIQVDAAKVPPVQVVPSVGYWRTVGQRLWRDKVAMAAALVILCLLFLALFGGWITPADPYKSSMLSRLKPIGTPNFLWAPMSWGATCSRASWWVPD
jgi:peptide/nickel transport system permease protein